MLRKRREEKELSLLKIAQNLNVTESYLSKLEKHPHECNPTTRLIIGLSEELDLHRIIVFEYFASAIIGENEELFWYI